MNYLDKVTELYVLINDFHKEFSPFIEEYTLSSSTDVKKRRKREFKLFQSEVMTLLVFSFNQNRSLD